MKQTNQSVKASTGLLGDIAMGSTPRRAVDSVEYRISRWGSKVGLEPSVKPSSSQNPSKSWRSL